MSLDWRNGGLDRPVAFDPSNLEHRVAEAQQLEILLRKQQAEVERLEQQLLQARAVNCNYPGDASTEALGIFESQRRRAAEVHLLEEELSRLTSGPSAAWLRRPTSSHEHEVLRRQHLSKAQQLEAELAKARGQLFHPLDPAPAVFSARMAGWEPSYSSTCARPESSPVAAWPLRTPQPQEETEVVPAEVLAERRRQFGDRMFRLWVEDFPHRGGIRLHALDTVSFARLHADIKDVDVQSMFHHYHRQLVRLRPPREHEEELTAFLHLLLDAVYFELADSGQLEMRVPQFVDPPRPPPNGALVDIPTRVVSSSRPLSVKWIQQKLWVPREVAEATAPSARRRPQSARRAERQDEEGAYAYGESSTRKPPTLRQYAPPSRPSSRPASARSTSSRASTRVDLPPRPTFCGAQAAQAPSREQNAWPLQGGGPLPPRLPSNCGSSRSLEEKLVERKASMTSVRSIPPCGAGSLPVATSTGPPSRPQSDGRPLLGPATSAVSSFSIGSAAELYTQRPAVRQTRPLSAKAQKHKRVPLSHDPVVYDDLEPSVCEEHDFLETLEQGSEVALPIAVSSAHNEKHGACLGSAEVEEVWPMVSVASSEFSQLSVSHVPGAEHGKRGHEQHRRL